MRHCVVQQIGPVFTVALMYYSTEKRKEMYIFSQRGELATILQGVTSEKMSQDSSVSLATRYRLDPPGIDSQCG